MVRSILLAVTWFLSLAVAHAGVIFNAQYGVSGTPYTGAAVVGAAGDLWNFLGSDGTAALLGPSDASTVLTMTWSSYGAYTQSDASNQNGFSTTPYAGLMESYLRADGGDPMDITITGLMPDTPYDLYVYSEGDFASDGREVIISVNGGPSTVTAATDYTAATFIAGQNYVQLAVQSDASGQLNIDAVGNGGFWAEGDINGLQLASTSESPEPSSLALATAGLIGLAWRRRSK